MVMAGDSEDLLMRCCCLQALFSSLAELCFVRNESGAHVI